MTDERFVPRYNLRQRVAHWTWAVAGLGLLVSGLVILFGAPTDVVRLAGAVHRVCAVTVAWAIGFYLVAAPRGFWQLVREAVRYDRDDRAWLRRAYVHLLGRAEGMPPQGRHNAGEKFHHLMNLFLAVTVGLSGAVLWWGKGIVSPQVFVIAVMVHNLSMLGLIVLLAGHVFFTFVFDMLVSMTQGVMSRRLAQREHAKWLAELEGRHAD